MLCCLRGRAVLAMFLSTHPNLFSFLFWMKSILRKAECPWVSSKVSTLLVFPNQGWKGLWPVCKLLLVLQPLPRSVCILPNAQVGKTGPGFLRVWCWNPQLSQVLLIMGGCLISCLKRRTKGEMSYDADVTPLIISVDYKLKGNL